MKNFSNKIALVALVTASALSFAGDGNSSLFLTVGKAPADYGNKTSMSIGMKVNEHFGVAIGSVQNKGGVTPDLDYPVPHNMYTQYPEQNSKGVYGFDIQGYHKVSDKIELLAGVGVYRQEKAVYAKSNITGWIYTQEESSKYKGAAELGINYNFENKAKVGVGYHSVRGAYVSAGFAF